MSKLLLCKQSYLGSYLLPKRSVFKAGPEAPKEGAPEKGKAEKKEGPKDILQALATIGTNEVLSPKELRMSAPCFRTPDQYPRDAEGHILSMVTGKRMTDAEIKRDWEFYDKLPAIYKIKHDVPPDTMPEKLDIPKGKEVFVIGGEHHAGKVAEKLSSQYKDTKVNFMQAQSLGDMIKAAQDMEGKYPKEKLAGSTVTLMVDPDIFFTEQTAKDMENQLSQLVKILKGYGLNVAFATATPIGDYYYEQGGPGSKFEQMKDWKKTDAARDKRSAFNEAVRKLFLNKGGVDRVMEADMSFGFYKEHTRLHPEYRSKNAYLNDNGIDLAARIFAQGINVVNGGQANPGNGVIPKEGGGSKIEAPAVIVESAKPLNVPPINPPVELAEGPKLRMENLVRTIAAMRDGTLTAKPNEVIEKALRDIQWAKDQGVDVAQIEAVEKDMKRELPKFLVTFAEGRVAEILKAQLKPTEYNLSQTIIAVDDAQKALNEAEKAKVEVPDRGDLEKRLIAMRKKLTEANEVWKKQA